jgi:hypothetical protein
MGTVVSLIIIALGAILTFAVTNDSSEGIDLDVVGIILMIVGLIGFILSLMYWSSWGGPGFVRRRTYVEGDPAYPAHGRRTRVVEEEEDGVPTRAGPPGPPPP